MNVEIPYPNNPAHTDNLATIPLLEAQDWEGCDASLEISLFEYGFAWRTLPEVDRDGDDTLFIFEITGRSSKRFDRVGMSSKIDFYKEFNWISEEDWDNFWNVHDTTKEAWDEQEFARKIEDLNRHWGRMNIMGDSYWEGFEIKDPSED